MLARFLCTAILAIAFQSVQKVDCNNATEGMFWIAPPKNFFVAASIPICQRMQSALYSVKIINNDNLSQSVDNLLNSKNIKSFVYKKESFLRSMRSWRLTKVFTAVTNSSDDNWESVYASATESNIWQWYEALDSLIDTAEEIYDKLYFYYYLKNHGVGACDGRIVVSREAIHNYIRQMENYGLKLRHGMFEFEKSSMYRLLKCSKYNFVTLKSMLNKMIDKYLIIQNYYLHLMESIYRNLLDKTSATESFGVIFSTYKTLSDMVWSTELSSEMQKNSYAINDCGTNQLDLKYESIMLSRIALSRLAVLLKTVNVSLVPSALSHDVFKNVSCMIVSEDIDKSLEEHLNIEEINEINLIIRQACVKAANFSSTNTLLVQLRWLWSQTRITINHQFSAYSQYYYRIDAILSIRSTLRITILIIAALGILFNIILVLYHARRTNYKLSHNMLIMALGVFDVFVLVIAWLCIYMDKFMEFDQTLKPTVFSDLWCKTAPYMQYFSIECSAWTLLLISFERCFLVFNILKGRQSKLLDFRKILVMLLGILLCLVLTNFALMIADEITGPSRSTQGHHCVHYVRLHNARQNIHYLTVIRPWIIANIRCFFPFIGVLGLNLVSCWYLFCKVNYFTNFYSMGDGVVAADDEEEEPVDSGTVEIVLKREIRASFRLTCVSMAYLLLSSPAPILYSMYMTMHGDLLKLQLNNALVPMDDPQFRKHWRLIGHLTAGMYITDYLLIPLCCSINLFVFILVDRRLRRRLFDFVRCRPSRPLPTQPFSVSVGDGLDNLAHSSSVIFENLHELQCHFPFDNRAENEFCAAPADQQNGAVANEFNALCSTEEQIARMSTEVQVAIVESKHQTDSFI